MSLWLSSKEDAALMVQKAYALMLSWKDHDLTPGSKLYKVVEILQNILEEDKTKLCSERRKILIYCAWPSLWPIIQAHLKHHGIYAMLIRDSGSSGRDRLIADFQREEAHIVDHNESYVAIISGALSTGVNLTRASVIIMMVGDILPCS